MKALLLITYLFINVLLLSAQSNSGKFDWAFNTGGGFNTVNRMHYNSVGDLLTMVTIGDTAQFGNTVIGAAKQNSNPGNLTFIGKRTQTGVYKVLIQFKPTNVYTQITAYDFALDASDNIIVSGTVLDWAGGGPSDFGNGVTLAGKGFFIAKYNSEGLAQWAKRYDLNTTFSAYNSPISLGILPNNDIYFAAQSPNAGNPFWLVRLKTDGTEIWHKELLLRRELRSANVFSSKHNFFFDNEGTTYFMVPLPSDHSLTINGEVIQANPGTHPSTTFLLSFDGDGNKKEYSGYRGGIGDFAVEKETGNIILKWAQYNVNPAPFNTIAYNVNNQYQGFVVLDKDRKYLKSSAASFLLTSDIESIYPLGNFEIAGNETAEPTISYTAGAQNYTTTAGKYAPIWKFFDSNLNIKSLVAHPEMNAYSSMSSIYMAAWRNKLAVSGAYSLADNASVNINGTVLTTCFKDLKFGTKFPTWASLAGDIFIAQLTRDGGSTTAIPNLDENFVQARIYPNPASEFLNIELVSGNASKSISITSLSGQKMFSGEFAGSSTQLDVSRYAKGIYLVSVTSDHKTNTQKLVIN